MSWESKTDYCDLAVANKLLVKSANTNTTSQYLEKHGANGAYKKTKVFGTRSAPSNTYAVVDTVTFTSKKLGGKKSVAGENKTYALEKLSWSTGADQEPTVDASAQEVKYAASPTTTRYFAIPEFSISPDQVAQIPSFKFPVSSGTPTAVPAFTLSGTDCELTACGGEISCKVGTNDKNGEPQYNDVTNGHVVVNVTIAQYGTTAPTLTAGSGWDVSSALTCDDPDSDMPTWTATLTHPLEKTMA